MKVFAIFFYPAFTTLYEFGPPYCRGSEITRKDAPQTVVLLWTSDQPVAETSTWQHTQHSQRTTIHAPGGIRTRNPSKQSAVDTRRTGVVCDCKVKYTASSKQKVPVCFRTVWIFIDILLMM
jgi:hypothetical protein